MAEYRPEREKRPPCLVPAILPVFPYPGDNLPSRTVSYNVGSRNLSFDFFDIHICKSIEKARRKTCLQR